MQPACFQGGAIRRLTKQIDELASLLFDWNPARAWAFIADRHASPHQHEE
jgi:hypothetical protein